MDGGSGDRHSRSTSTRSNSWPTRTAFSDARTWTKYIGVVSEKPTYVVTNFTRKERIRQDFFSGPRGVEESLENVDAQFDTDRHVFVGATTRTPLAETAGWEYLPVTQAAEAADWVLGEPETPTPQLSRTSGATTGPSGTAARSPRFRSPISYATEATTVLALVGCFSDGI